MHATPHTALALPSPLGFEQQRLNPHYMKKGTHHYPTPGTRKKNSAHNIPNLKSTLHTQSNPTQEADAIHILHVIVSSHDNRLVVQRSRFAFAHDQHTNDHSPSIIQFRIVADAVHVPVVREREHFKLLPLKTAIEITIGIVVVCSGLQ